MKKPGEKLALLAVALGVVAVGLLLALQSGTSQRRTQAVAAFRKNVPPAMVERLRAETDTDALPANTPAQKEPGVDTTAAFEEFWPRLALQNAPGSLWSEIQLRKGKNRHDPYDDAEIARMKRFIAENQEFIDEIKRLAELGGPVIDLDYSQGMALELPHLAKMREMARVLRTEAIVLAEDGDFAGAAQNILLTIKLGDALKEEPILISQLVRFAIGGIASDAARDALPPGECPPEALGPLLAYTAQADHHDRFAESMTGEGVLGLVEFDRIREGGMTVGVTDDYLGQIAAAVYSSPVGAPWMNMDEATYAEVMARMAEASALPYYEARPILEGIEADVEALPITRLISRTMLPALTRAARAQARHEVHLDLMQLGLLVEQHHAEHGVYPESLNTITGGQQPLDPFTGEPYRYSLSGDGFTLYSLGSNLTDDGGRHNYNDGDIVWRGVEIRE